MNDGTTSATSAKLRAGMPVLLILLVLAFLAAPVAAYAAGTWASAYPMGTIHVQPSTIAVDLFGTAKLNANTAKITLAGSPQKTFVTNVGPATGHWVATETQNPITGVWTVTWTWAPDSAGTTKATICCYPTTLTEGTRSVVVSVKDINNNTYSYSWAFTVGIPPTFGAPMPADGVRVTTPVPAIWVPVSDNTGVTSASATINGNPCTATLGGGKMTVTGFTLSADGPVTVVANAGDAGGNISTRAWTFSLSYYANQSCHAVGCHGTTYDTDNAMGPDCVSCHGSVDHTAVHAGGLTGLDACTGADCHVDNLADAHADDCAICHASADPIVQGAIAAGGATCVTCHSVLDHTAVHAGGLTGLADCAGAGCHVDNLVTEHVTDHALACATCHASSDSTVVEAISAGGATCTTCHALPDHTAVHDTTLSTDCSECHASNLVTEHVTDRALTCGTCHASSDPDVTGAISSGDSDCAACHGASAGGHLEAHVGGLTGLADCAGSGCHVDNLVTEHVTDHALACATCHASADPTVQGAILAGGATCTTCHSPLPDHTVVHDTTLSTDCAECHASNLVTEHVTDRALTCATCHQSTDPDVTGAIASSDTSCAACHGVDAGSHLALHVGGLTGLADCTGAGCHVDNLVTEHVTDHALACATCHASADPTVQGAILAGGATCTTCHSPLPDHTAVHDTTLSTDCSECHAPNLVTEHVTDRSLTCGTCHESTDPDVTGAIASSDTSCTACHGADAGNHLAAHTASLTQAAIVFFYADTQHQLDGGGGEIDVNVTCSWCHGPMNLVTLHGSNCTLCHGGSAPPAESFTTWNGGCSQGACHPSYHQTASSAHDFWYSDDVDGDYCNDCHDYVWYSSDSPVDASSDWCGRCHTLY